MGLVVVFWLVLFFCLYCCVWVKVFRYLKEVLRAFQLVFTFLCSFGWLYGYS